VTWQRVVRYTAISNKTARATTSLFVNDALAAETQRVTGAVRTRVSNFKRVTP